MSKKIVLAVALVAAAAAGFLLQSTLRTSDVATLPKQEHEQTNRIAFTLPDLEGRPHKLADWDGKARLVNFWATWCAPCRREIPLLKETQDKYADDNLQIIGVAVDFQEQVAAYAEEAAFNYPILIGQEDAMAAAEASGVDFIGMPFTLIISPEGDLLKAHVGEIVAVQIELIMGVFSQLQAGEMDLAAARSALQEL